MFLVLSITLSLTAIGFFALAASLLLAERRRLQERISAVLATPGAVDPALVDEYIDQSQSGWARSVRPVTDPFAAMLPDATRKAIRGKLAQAGLLRHFGEAEYVALRFLAVLAGVGVGLVFHQWLVHKGLDPLLAFGGAFFCVIAAVLVPEYWLQSRIQFMQFCIRKTLPDALDLLTVSMEAGTGFDGAAAKVTEKFPGPIAREFDRVLQEMRLGKPRLQALRDMATRLNMTEVTTFVSAVCQADQLGVSMAQVLRIQAQTLRQKRLYMIREAAQKLPVKMLFPLIFCIFPALFVIIMGSGVITIMEAFGQ